MVFHLFIAKLSLKIHNKIRETHRREQECSQVSVAGSSEFHRKKRESRKFATEIVLRVEECVCKYEENGE